MRKGLLITCKKQKIDKEACMERDIRKIKNVALQTNNPTHTNGFVLEPGNWEEYDRF